MTEEMYKQELIKLGFSVSSGGPLPIINGEVDYKNLERLLSTELKPERGDKEVIVYIEGPLENPPRYGVTVYSKK